MSHGGNAKIGGVVVVAAGNGSPLFELALLCQDNNPLLEDGLGDKEAVVYKGEEGNLVEVDLGDGQTRYL